MDLIEALFGYVGSRAGRGVADRAGPRVGDAGYRGRPERHGRVPPADLPLVLPHQPAGRHGLSRASRLRDGRDGVALRPARAGLRAAAHGSCLRRAGNHEHSADSEPWPPIPARRPPARPLEDVRASYAFAARRPDVLHCIPCYCGCDHIESHESNLRCHTKPPQGGVGPVWDAHAFT